MAALLAAAGCANDPGPHPDLPRIGLYAAFGSHNLCGLGVSPEIRLVMPPADTAVYRFKMTNVSALSGPSWEFTVPPSVTYVRAGGETIVPEGAIPDFPAPCVPENIIQQYFNYRVEVMAMGRDNRPIGYGWGFAGAYSLTRQLGLERVRAQQQQRERAAAARDAAAQNAAPATPAASAQNAPAATAENAPVSSQPDMNQPPVASAPLVTAPFPGTFGAVPAPGAQPQIGPPIVRPYVPYPPQVTSYFFTY